MSGPPGAPPGDPPRCANCGAPVADRFCPRCGQRRGAHLLSLRRMAAEFFDDQFSLNGTLPRSLGALLFRPGFLTREYASGRIVRYVRPFRLFLVSSVLFFVALSSVADADDLMRAGGLTDEDLARVQLPAGEGGAPRWDNLRFGIDPAGVPRWMRPLMRRMGEAEQRFNSMPPRLATAAMLEAVVQTGARVSFLLVPGFAGLLLALHFRRRPRFVEHFVFALHFHAFAFLLMTPLLFLGNRVLWSAAGIAMLLYLFVALKRAYAQPWGAAGLKLAVVGLVYPLALSFAVSGAMLAALLLA